MSLWLADQFILELIKRKLYTQKTKILVLGLSFKENCPDIRNTKVIDLINHLKKFNLDLTILDPFVNKKEVLKTLNINVIDELPNNQKFNGVIVTLAHDPFRNLAKEDWENLIKKDGIFFDLKNIVPETLNPIRI